MTEKRKKIAKEKDEMRKKRKCLKKEMRKGYNEKRIQREKDTKRKGYKSEVIASLLAEVIASLFSQR